MQYIVEVNRYRNWLVTLVNFYLSIDHSSRKNSKCSHNFFIVHIGGSSENNDRKIKPCNCFLLHVPYNEIVLDGLTGKLTLNSYSSTR